MSKKRGRKRKLQHSKRHRHEHRVILRWLDRHSARTGLVVVLVGHVNPSAGEPAGAGAEPTLEAGPARRLPARGGECRPGRRGAQVVPEAG